MALTINTNVSALNAHMNMKKTDNALSSSLGRLSTGLRINKAADDASGLAIADSLKAQSAGLGQAIKNANDGISIVQTADGALEEATNIVNTIKTKAIQAAQDGQTFASRKIIQKDITKLLEEVDLLASSTSFNGKKLLSGNFTNMSFQVGATTNETIGVSIKSAETAKIGHVTTANLKVTDSGPLSLVIHSNEQDKDFTLEAVNMQYDNTAANGIGALANAINKSSDQTGITASAVVQSTSGGAINAGEIGGDFKINGIAMGSVSVKENDSDGTLQAAINQKSDQTGVTASINDGILTLNSVDGRGIEIKGNLGQVMGKNASAMSTFGELKITQTGSNTLAIKDSASGELTTTEFVTSADLTVGSSMVLGKGSSVLTTSTYAAGTKIGFSLATADAATTQDSTVAAGSTILSGATIAAGTTLGGKFTTSTAVAGTLISNGSALLTKGTTLAAATTLAAGTVLSTDISTAAGIIKAGSTLSAETTTNAAVTLEGDMTVKKGSTLAALSVLNTGSVLTEDTFETGANSGISEDMTLKKGSNILISTLAAGSTLGVNITSGAGTGTTTEETILATGSELASGATLAAGSTIGGTTQVASKKVAADTTMAAGSTITSASTIAAGTYLTNDISTAAGTIKAGVTLEQDVITDTATVLANEMTIAKGSTLAAASIFASAGGGGSSAISIEDTKVTRLQDIDVTTQEGAQIAIAVADSALAAYNDIRSDLGSTQNQLTSTISNISVTQINVSSAESAIRDVDFAAESQNFSKLQILAQSGAYAMAQANSSSQTVMSLLQ
ncbi:MAG: flagellin [Desulfobacterium sp.]|nr:flagellin [Desulfobacterium sp.]